MTTSIVGVLLMTYGSATTAENVQAYMDHVYPNGVPQGLVEDFENRYALVGQSPLIAITREQARLTQELLNGKKAANIQYVVRVGMLHSAPFIADSLAELRQAGAERIIGIMLAPQFSPLIMSGYGVAWAEAINAQGYDESTAHIVESWPLEPHFIQLLAERTSAKLAELTKRYGMAPTVLFTTHSLPERVVDRDRSYLDQLKATTEAVVAKLGQPNLIWHQAYQSAGHTPEPWLKPDIVDVLADIRREQPNEKGILIVPLQFLADHLEILYDLDIAGGEQCAEFGFEYNRIELPNTAPLLIEALASIVLQESTDTVKAHSAPSRSIRSDKA